MAKFSNDTGSCSHLDHSQAGHNHSALHGHNHVSDRKFKWAFWLTLGIFLVEVIGGSLANSLALLGDAGHVLTDVVALGLAWFAAAQARKQSTAKHTFGFHRTGIMAALANAVTLIIIAVLILVEAVGRLNNPQPVQTATMYGSAGFGLVINLVIAFSFRGGEANLNVRSALLHVLGDAAASAAVIIGGIVISFTGWYILDPILSVLISLLIAWSALKIAKEALHILMEGTPAGFNSHNLVTYVQNLCPDCDIHDLHVWSVTPERVALSCHLVVAPAMDLLDVVDCIDNIKKYLSKEFGISHATIEVEINQCECTTLFCQDSLWQTSNEPHFVH